MQVIAQQTYGGPEVLRLADADEPTPGKGQVRVRVRAASADAGVWYLTTGRPLITRPFFGVRAPRIKVAGQEFAGTVETVGPGVTQFVVGDEVFGVGEGTFAELTLAREDRIARRPEDVSAEDAAALPVSGSTALQAVRDAGRVDHGRVLVIGAGGGVGSFAVQLAASYGATVTGVAGSDKVELVRLLGAVRVLDYTRDALTAAGVHEVVIDTAGNRPLREVRGLLTDGGTLVLVGAGLSVSPMSGLVRNARAAFLTPFTRQRLRAPFAVPRPADLELLARMVANGQLRPAIEAVRPLSDAPDVVRTLGEGHARGKTVLVP